MLSGSITLLIGPTFAGKTTELIRHLNRYRVMRQKVCLILHESDKDNITKFSFLGSNQIIKSSFLVENITNKIVIDADVIAIDNLHFFKDTLHVIPFLANKLNKIIVCAGLDNDFNRNMYENVLQLVPKAENVEKLTAFCSVELNGNAGIFSKKIGDKYTALSRKSYLEKPTGYLHVITGPMFSGKTTELIRIAKQYQSINKKILSINYSKDTRYDEEAKIFSHDKQKFETTLALDDLSNIPIEDSEVVIIDEIQFFKNSFSVIKSLVEDHNKIVILSGLDGDYLQNPFGDICRLIAFADKLTRLTAICRLGDNYPNASFSKRIVKSDLTEFIGSDDAYMAVSRQIYNLSETEFLEKLRGNSNIQLE